MDADHVSALHLEELRRAAASRVDAAAVSLAALVHDRSTLHDDDEHDPDGAPLSQEWSRLTGQLAAARQDLEQIEAAFLRRERGTFGLCTNCGNPIAAVRLRVRPFAELCLACAERLPGQSRSVR